MPDSDKKGDETRGAGSAGAPAPRVVLMLDFDPATLDMQITGPLNRPALVLALLEMARSTIANYWHRNPDVQERRIVQAQGTIPFRHA